MADHDVLDRDHLRGLVARLDGQVVGGVRDLVLGLGLALELLLELVELELEHVLELVALDLVLELELVELGLELGVELAESGHSLDLDPDDQLEDHVHQELDLVLKVLGQLGLDVELRHVLLLSFGRQCLSVSV